MPTLLDVEIWFEAFRFVNIWRMKCCMVREKRLIGGGT
jgi:hypothetical protein